MLTWQVNLNKVVDAIPTDARFVLLGASSHGTHEWYTMRAQLTKMLIEERGFDAIAIEADFPAAERVNFFVRDLSPDDLTPTQSLKDFKKFPQWLYGNDEFDHFVGWLHGYNRANKLVGNMDKAGGVGVYGMDIYSRNASAHTVIKYLDEVDAVAAKRARQRYACFERYGNDAVSYAFKNAHGDTGCEDAAMAVLMDVIKKRAEYERKSDGGVLAAEKTFSALVNARVVKDAEEYYRLMFFSREADTWNIRDTNMFDTVQAIEQHLREDYHVAAPKIVIWAHNRHISDARASDMGRVRGESNLGQLMRQAYGNQAYNVGFLTHHGTVAAAEEWGEPVKLKKLKRSLPGSYEKLLHDTGLPSLAIDLRNASPEVHAALQGPKWQRYVGVIYEPKAEHLNHYSKSWLPEQYDMVVHVDETKALAPLDADPNWDKFQFQDQEGEPPDTYPFGI
ncbi:hypothetical protein WJX72_005159 [[Myrmecia] bisecta]|uniref:Erythromycin esterase n=1 Tax=[Myrmecia] bisecta TaxID=41462 RepID=A0AAW1PAW0_9CHLO